MVRFGPLLSAMALTAFASTAFAQQPYCTKRSEFVFHLAQAYDEKVTATGLANNGNLVQVLSSSSGKTWTIIITTPDGNACRIAAGKYWDYTPPGKMHGPY